MTDEDHPPDPATEADREIERARSTAMSSSEARRAAERALGRTLPESDVLRTFTSLSPKVAPIAAIDRLTSSIDGIAPIPVFQSAASQDLRKQMQEMEHHRQHVVRDLAAAHEKHLREDAEALQRELDSLDLTRTLVDQQALLLVQQEVLVQTQQTQLALQQKAAAASAGERLRSILILITTVIGVLVGAAGVWIAMSAK